MDIPQIDLPLDDGPQTLLKKNQSNVSFTSAVHSTGGKGGRGEGGDKIIGFMPKRGEFEVEYDEEAETRICEMEFNDDDTIEE